MKLGLNFNGFTLLGICPFQVPKVLVIGVVAVLLVVGGGRFSQSAYAVQGGTWEQRTPLSEMEIPTLDQLLDEIPFDWIVLNSPEKEVLIVERINLDYDFPTRPGMLERLEGERKRLLAKGRLTEDDAQILPTLSKIPVILHGGEDNELYEISVNQIDHILFYEDLYLKRLKLLFQQGDEKSTRQARELHYQFLISETHRVKRERDRGVPATLWPGVEDLGVDFLVIEIDRFLSTGRLERALMTMKELAAKAPEHELLKSSLVRCAQSLVEPAIAQQDYRRARVYLQALFKISAQDEYLKRLKKEIQQIALEVAQLAEEQFSRGEYSQAHDTIDSANRIWPSLSKVRQFRQQISARYPILKVGVLSYAGETVDLGEWLEAEADWLERMLVETPFFEVSRLVDGRPRYKSRFLEDWVPEELGRSTLFTLNTQPQPWQAQQWLSAPMAVEALQQKIDPENSKYDERLAHYIHQVHLESLEQFRIDYQVVPLQVEGFLSYVLQAAIPTSFSLEDLPPAGLLKTPDFQTVRFRREVQEPDRWIYRRVIPESDPGAGRRYHVAEIQLKKYKTAKIMLQAFFRGELSVLHGYPTRDYAVLEGDKRVSLMKLETPVVHSIQFNPQKKLNQNPLFRQAFMHSFNRQGVLDEVYVRQGLPLKSSWRQVARLTSGIFHQESYAYDSSVKSPDYNPYLATSLFAAVRKNAELSGPIHLNIAYDGEAQCLDALTSIAQRLEPFHVKLHILSPDELKAAPGSWDLVYRRTRYTDPLKSLWDYLSLDQPAGVSSIEYLPAWLRQKILYLEKIVDWDSAQQLLREIHYDLVEESYVFPLWEVDDYLLIRKGVRNLPTSMVHPYSDLDHWTVDER